MARTHVNHREIAQFAAERVNLPKEYADEYRAQAGRLRDRLESYLGEHPDFTLKKMMLSGSLAKGTALRTLNDIDVACYISGADVPRDVHKLMEYLAERLRKAFPNFKPEQVKPQNYSVTVSFVGTGLDVDVVPILYDGDKDWFGNLVSKDDGSYLKTNIPYHLEFIRKRKARQPDDFAQVARLIKFWTRKMKADHQGFRFKSFMVELVLAHLADNGAEMSDYPEALQNFFTYIATTNFGKLVVFDDYYKPSTVGAFTTPIKIIDPVNALNNVGQLYDQALVKQIVDAALDAGDAIDAALAAPTKGETVRYWQRVFGPSFQG